MITAMTTHRQPRDRGRPSGNSSRASGRKSPIDHGQVQLKIVITRRCTAMGAAAWCSRKSSGAANAAVDCATPPAANSQPIGLCGRAAAAIGLCVIRVLSALTAVPAFYVGGVPGPIMAVAGSFIILTVVGVVLTLAGLRRPALVSA